MLEATQFGYPVVASNTSSLPEVVGDAGVLIQPTDVDGFRDAMEKICNDVSMQVILREMGLKQASEFSWEKSFNLLLQNIESTLV